MWSIFEDQKKLLILSSVTNLGLLIALLASRAKAKKERQAERQLAVQQRRPKAAHSRRESNMRVDYGDVLNPVEELKRIDFSQGQMLNASKGQYYKDIYSVCLTGGPCAGKTTALAEITLKLKSFGIEVFCVPETATLTMMGGGNIIVRDFPPKLAIRREIQIVQFQQDLENYFRELANIKKKTFKNKVVLLYDRGCMDARAYLPQELWQAIMDQKGWNPIVLSHKRYDMVLHLVTAADGAEKFYTTENNQARYETAEQARDIDKKLQDAYNGHPHHKIIRNIALKDFQYKMDTVIEEMLSCIEMTDASGQLAHFKYLLRDTDVVYPADMSVETVSVEESVLREIKDEKHNIIFRLLIKQTKSQAIDYCLSSSIVNPETKEKRFLQMKKIPVSKYLEYQDECDDAYHISKVKKVCFIWKKKTYSVEEHVVGEKRISLLLVGRGKDDKYDDVELQPEFLQPKIEKIITDDESFEFSRLYHK